MLQAFDKGPWPRMSGEHSCRNRIPWFAMMQPCHTHKCAESTVTWDCRGPANRGLLAAGRERGTILYKFADLMEVTPHSLLL